MLPDEPIRLDLRAHLRRQLLTEEFEPARSSTLADLEERIIGELVHRWPAQVAATFSDQDLADAGCDPDRLRRAVLRALGRKNASGTDITISVTDHYSRARAILWRGRTLARGRRS